MPPIIQVKYRGELYYTTKDIVTGRYREPFIQRLTDGSGIVLCWPRRRTWLHTASDGVPQRVRMLGADGHTVVADTDVTTNATNNLPELRDANTFEDEMELVEPH